MQDQLLGYLLNALEPSEHELVEQQLATDRQLQQELELLRNSIEPLEAEGLSLTLVARSLGPRTSHSPGATYARRRLVDRVKVLLAGDLSRRWTLAEIAAEMGGSAVYLTQVFQQVEGLPLCDWVLLDARDAIVHIFRPDVRQFYNLEKMWSADRPGESHRS